MLPNMELDADTELISFDVSSLYTNVPLDEAIKDCANLLFSGNYPKPPVDRSTFVELATLCSSNVILSTHDGYYRQVDGLAMGSPSAPQLANGWLSKFDPRIQDEASLYKRYMDDILREIKTDHIDEKLKEINEMHPSLKFTVERENNSAIPFLDMKIERKNGKLSSKWYSKPTDTGLTMNYHALAPIKYKRSVVSGFVHRIYRSCSNWHNFHESLEKAKSVLENNQYPKSFYEPIIKRTLDKIVENEKADDNKNEKVDDSENDEEKKEKKRRRKCFLCLIVVKFPRSLSNH